MDFIDKINDIATRASKQIDYIGTEEATKNAFVMPFISALGYDIFNPIEVVPEFTADTGTKKGEKVDYALKKDNQVIMLIECKWCGCNLDKIHPSQLYRYFSVSEARFSILTNGLQYQFFSDIAEPNKMDEKPFFMFDILNFEDRHIEELKKFTKPSFDLDNILNTASQLKYVNSIKKLFSEQVDSPTDDFVRFFVSKVYGGLKTQTVIDQFAKVVKDALNQFIRERINDRLKSALDGSVDIAMPAEEFCDEQDKKNDIVTTQEETEGYNIVKAIVREVIDPGRVTMRDTKSYCGILLDNNNRKPICRLHFNYSQKYLGIITGKDEERIPINDLNEIFKHADNLKATVNSYAT